jgi:hypothetical protein
MLYSVCGIFRSIYQYFRRFPLIGYTVALAFGMTVWQLEAAAASPPNIILIMETSRVMAIRS